VHNRIILAVKRVEFVSDRMSYVILKGLWCHISVLNVHAPKTNKTKQTPWSESASELYRRSDRVHAPTEDKTDDVKDSFYEELEHVFHKFPKYHLKILLVDFSAKLGRKNI
jgi:hypothetical protein